MKENLTLLTEMCNDNFDWESHFNKPNAKYRHELIADVFPAQNEESFLLELEKNYTRVKYARGLDTPKMLYRLFFCYRKNATEMGRQIQDDFYESGLLLAKSFDGATAFDFYIFKYELHVGFYAKNGLCIECEKKPLDLKSIWRYDKVNCTEEATIQFDALTKAIIETPFTIYSGNNFVV